MEYLMLLRMHKQLHHLDCRCNTAPGKARCTACTWGNERLRLGPDCDDDLDISCMVRTSGCEVHILLSYTSSSITGKILAAHQCTPGLLVLPCAIVVLHESAIVPGCRDESL
jgi:hypothetical protein